MNYFFIILAALVALNLYLLLRRSKKGRNAGRDATARREEIVKHHDELVRMLELEQDEAARRVELRNRTYELYDQVRKQGEKEEQE